MYKKIYGLCLFISFIFSQDVLSFENEVFIQCNSCITEVEYQQRVREHTAHLGESGNALIIRLLA